MNRKIYLSAILCCFLCIAGAQTTQLTVRGYTEGYYRPSTGKLAAVIDSVNLPNICDTAVISLIDTVSSLTVFCDSVLVNTSGYGVSTVPASFHGQRFLVSIKFKNSF